MQYIFLNYPVYDFGFYVGGPALSSSCYQATASWVSQVYSEGWTFMPIWVGLQPDPGCSTAGGPYSSSQEISQDPTNNYGTAYTQGKAQANAAITAAKALGFYSGTTLYDDIEQFDAAGQSGACGASANAYVNGWDYQMYNTNGYHAGVYGAASNVSPWWNLTHVPTDIWIASWNKSNSVWNISGVSNSLWNSGGQPDRRLHQYQNNLIVDTYYTVDADCENGLVVPYGTGDSYQSGDDESLGGVTEDATCP